MHDDPGNTLKPYLPYLQTTLTVAEAHRDTGGALAAGHYNAGLQVEDDERRRQPNAAGGCEILEGDASGGWDGLAGRRGQADRVGEGRPIRGHGRHAEGRNVYGHLRARLPDLPAATSALVSRVASLPCLLHLRISQIRSTVAKVRFGKCS